MSIKSSPVLLGKTNNRRPSAVRAIVDSMPGGHDTIGATLHAQVAVL